MIIKISLSIVIYLDRAKCLLDNRFFRTLIPSDIGLKSILENVTNFNHPIWNKDLFEIKDEVIAQSI